MDATPEFLDVLDALQSKAAKWTSIGLQLHLSSDELDIIRADSHDVGECLTGVIRKWRTKTEPRPTWQAIVDALRAPAVGEDVLAKRLEERYALAVQAVQSEPESIAESDASIEVARRSLMQIKQSFATLVTKVAVKLRSKELDLEVFRFFIVNLFPPGKCIPHSTNIITIFEAITQNGLWSYWHYVPVEDITKEYAPDDDEVREWMDGYRKKLSDYKAATSIANAIKLYSSNIDEFEEGGRSCLPASMYDPSYLRRLTIKLKSRVTGKNLDYIDNLWVSMAEFFLLPSLSALLDNIQKGCLEVSWLIPPHFMFQITGNLQENAEFLKSKAIVKVLIDGECVYDEAQVEESVQRILSAVTKGDIDEVVALLTSGIDVNIRLESGNTLLMVAAYNKELTEVLRILLIYGADINMQNGAGWTALMMACEVGHFQVVEHLLEHGADTELKSKDGWTAVLIACSNNQLKIVQLLVEKLANVGVRNQEGQTSLMAACQNGNLDMVEYLITLPHEVNAKDKSGVTALMYASEIGKVDIVQKLLKHPEVDLDAGRHIDGSTALMYASDGDHVKCVELLLSCHADGNIRNTAGWTALMYASARGHLQTVKVLLSHEVDLNLQDEEGWTALMDASYRDHPEVVKELLNNGANADIKNTNGETALHIADICGHSNVVEVLKSSTSVEVTTKSTDAQSDTKFKEHKVNLELTSGHLADFRARLENRRIFREMLNRGSKGQDIMPKASTRTLPPMLWQKQQNKPWQSTD